MKYLCREGRAVQPASCPSRGTWIEMLNGKNIPCLPQSCPSRGTWIEIKVPPTFHAKHSVVPLAGHVD